LIHPDDREWLAKTLIEALETGRYDAEFRVVWADGSVRWLLGRGESTRDAKGCVTCLTGINIDITDRKLAEEQARHALAVAEEATAMKSRF
jgi:PAS domain S-box-containing protein